jgi:hypothetical protein
MTVARTFMSYPIDVCHKSVIKLQYPRRADFASIWLFAVVEKPESAIECRNSDTTSGRHFGQGWV